MATGKIRNCVVCGQICVDVGGGMCQKCYTAEQEKMEEIASYVRDNPNSKIKEIATALKVKESLIMRMMREGRFIMSDGRALEYPCEKCGAPITFGRLCDECSNKLSQEAMVVHQKLAAKVVAASQPKAPFAPKKPAMPDPSKDARDGMRSIEMGKKFTS